MPSLTPRRAGGVAALNAKGGSAPAIPAIPGSTRPADAIPQSLELPLPEDVPIPGASLFNPLGKATTVAVEVNKPIVGPDVGGALLVVKQNARARLDGVVVWVQGLQPTSDLVVSFFDGGAPIPGFSNLQVFPGLVALFALPISGKYVSGAGPTFTATYTNKDGGSYIIGAAIPRAGNGRSPRGRSGPVAG